MILIIICLFFFAVFVKQEPEDQHMKRQMQHVAAASAVLAAAGQNNANTGYVSSTTHMNGYNLPNRPLNGQPNAGKTIFLYLLYLTVLLYYIYILN